MFTKERSFVHLTIGVLATGDRYVKVAPSVVNLESPKGSSYAEPM